MVYMRVSQIEPSFQIVMKWVPALEYMLSGAHGLLQPCLILSGNERYRPQGPNAGHAYPVAEALWRGD
jgi:hypothetical protein